MSFLGYATCDECDELTYFDEPSNINIWFHPDDPKVLAEVDCVHCGYSIQARMGYDHLMNLKRRGCVVRDFNDKFEPLTEEMIDAWDIDAEVMDLLATAH
jgi:hypothetical protein